MISSAAKCEACASSNLGLRLPNFLLIYHIRCVPIQYCYVSKIVSLIRTWMGPYCFIENVMVGNSSTCSDLFWFTCIYIYIYIYIYLLDCVFHCSEVVYVCFSDHAMIIITKVVLYLLKICIHITDWLWIIFWFDYAKMAEGWLPSVHKSTDCLFV